MTPACSPAAAVLNVSEEGQILLVLLFPQLAGLRVHRIEDTGDAVSISASCTASSGCCPACGSVSARVHGGYSRSVADGAAGGRPVLIILRVPRFCCVSPACPRATFAVQADGLTSRYCRRSVPLTAMLTGFGLELAGRAGSRLAARLGIAVHPSTILRLLAALPEREADAAPEVLGIDDFSLRKGHVYGTVLVDMDTGGIVDLLPDREAATVEAWLKAHPDAAVICRDRAGAYCEAARNGAPSAIQVADRWHMWHNLAEYAHKAVTRHRGCLLAAGDRAEAGNGEPRAGREPAGTVPPDALLDEGGRERPLAVRTRERYADIRARADAGHSQAEIIRATGLSPKTVRRFARAGSVGELLGGAARSPGSTSSSPASASGGRKAPATAPRCTPEIQEQGWAGSARTVRRYLAQFREPGTVHEAPPAVPKARQITRLLLTRPDHLEDAEREQPARMRAGCPHIDALAGHVAAFAEMMDGLTGAVHLDPWLAAVEEPDGQPELRSFATGIRQDKDAVLNGLTLPYSSGRVEGTVNKIILWNLICQAAPRRFASENWWPIGLATERLGCCEDGNPWF